MIGCRPDGDHVSNLEDRKHRDRRTATMARSHAALFALLAGCYDPRLPEGAPCDSTRKCPSQQSCVLGRCSLQDAPPVDAEVLADAKEIDALVIDAHPDAAVLPCTADGFAACGAATLFTCGGRCWVRCSNATTWLRASPACSSWQGTLGQIDDATEQTCVASHIGIDSWIGLFQSDAATAPSLDWVWTTDTNPVLFMNWQSGKPDDRDGIENRVEQCGMFQSDGRWDDVACTEQHPFLCER
jgi:hypothetical protein